MTEKERNARNLDPHDSARAAMWLFGKRYSEQGGGSMDFWDGLSRSDKEPVSRNGRGDSPHPPRVCECRTLHPDYCRVHAV